MTRPDILYATSLSGRYASNPTIQHWNGVLRTISYLHRTKKDGTAIMKPKNIREEMVYDASFAPFGQNSQSSTILCIDRSLVGWSSAKQQIVTLSSAEAKYVAISSAAQDAS
jgi:hypothetical protein